MTKYYVANYNDLDNPPPIEQWLEDMEQAGYEFVSFSNGYWIFKIIEPAPAKELNLMNASKSTAELLEEIRKFRKITISELAVRSGVNRNTVSGILSGRLINKARLSTLLDIAHALNCELRIEIKPFEQFDDQIDE